MFTDCTNNMSQPDSWLNPGAEQQEGSCTEGHRSTGACAARGNQTQKHFPRFLLKYILFDPRSTCGKAQLFHWPLQDPHRLPGPSLLCFLTCGTKVTLSESSEINVKYTFSALVRIVWVATEI